jgi:hypothetical protein
MTIQPISALAAAYSAGPNAAKSAPPVQNTQKITQDTVQLSAAARAKVGADPDGDSH